MIYGRLQKEGNLLVHTIYNVPQNLANSVNDQVFLSNDLILAARDLEARPKFIRSMAQANYTSYPDPTPPTYTPDYHNQTENALNDHLNAVKLESTIQTSTEEIRGFCEDYLRCLDDYLSQCEVFRKTAKIHDKNKDHPVGQIAVAQGFKAVLLKRYLAYLLAALTHAARGVVLRTIPVSLEEDDEECRVVVNRALLDPAKFLVQIKKELSQKIV